MSGISSQSFSAPTPPIAGQEVGLQDQVGESPDLADQSDQISISNLTNIVNNISTTVTGSFNADLVAKLALWDPVVNPCISVAGRGTAGDKGGGTFHGVLVAGGPAMDNAMVFATANPLWRGIRDYTDHLCPNWYGTEGDGTTNDTVALQAALDATVTWGVPLRCDNLATYLVRYTGATYNGYALKLKHGTRLDLNGATIKLDADQWCSVILNEHVAGGGPDHVEIGNGVINGNEANQTRVWDAGLWKRAVGGIALTYTPTVILHNVDTPIVTDLRIEHGFISTFKMQAATTPYLEGITIEGSWGDGMHLSLLTDAYLDDLAASDCRATEEFPIWGSSSGQGLLLDGARISIGTITITNCTCPVKIQAGVAATTDIVWDKLFLRAGPLTCLPFGTPLAYPVWWGIKFQGTGPAPHNARIKVGSIVCDASDPAINFATQSIGAGIYCYATDDLEIANVTLIKCGRGYFSPGCDFKDWFGIKIHNCPRLRFGKIYDKESHGALLVHQLSPGSGTPCDTIEVDEVRQIDPQWAFNPAAVNGPIAIYNLDSAHIRVRTYKLEESVPPPFPTAFFNAMSMAADFSASIHIDEVVQNQPLSASMFYANLDAAIARVTVGKVRLDGLSKPAVGVATLTNGGITTPVTAAEVTSWAGLNPIISVQPQNTTAAALGLCTVTPGSAPSTGLVLGHGVAGASDIVSWQCLGYSSLAGLAKPRQWNTLAPAGGPPTGRSGPMMCWFPPTSTFIFFGGLTTAGAYKDETWAYDPFADTWTNLAPATTPASRALFGMCYDSVRQRIIMWGGYNVADVLTWEWYGGDWHSVVTAHNPTETAGCSLAYDSARQRVVCYGGANSPGGKETWEYDAADWTMTRSAAQGPGVYWNPALYYDAVRARVVLAGGFDGLNSTDGTYEYNGATPAWSAVFPSTSAWAARSSGVYDSIRSVGVQFGCYDGGGGPGIVDSTYERDIATWSLVNVLPSARCMMAGDYCPDLERIYAYGGTTTGLVAGGLDETLWYGR